MIGGFSFYVMSKNITVKKIGKHIKISITDEKNNQIFINLGIEETNKLLNQLLNTSFEITKEYANINL